MRRRTTGLTRAPACGYEVDVVVAVTVAAKGQVLAVGTEGETAYPADVGLKTGVELPQHLGIQFARLRPGAHFPLPDPPQKVA